MSSFLNLNRDSGLLACLALTFIGCSTNQGRMVVGADERPMVEIQLMEAPPVTPQCDLMPLPDYLKYRRGLVVDLNDEGIPEYFVEDCAGVHRMGFAVVDKEGHLLTRAGDVGEIGGDRLLVLTSSHHGYHDIVCSDCDPGGVDGALWRFDGKSYVKARTLKYSREDEVKAYMERTPGLVMICWYFDCFARPQADPSTEEELSEDVSI